MDKLIKQNRPTGDRQKTNFEIFCSEHGTLLLSEHFSLNGLRLKYGRCEMSLIRIQDTRSERASIALRIEVTNNDEGYERKSISILDDDEVTSLSEALKFLIGHQQKIIDNAETYTEVKYTSRGGFAAGLYVSDEKSVGVFIVVDGETAFLGSLSDLQDRIEDALFKIESLRVTRKL